MTIKIELAAIIGTALLVGCAHHQQAAGDAGRTVVATPAAPQEQPKTAIKDVVDLDSLLRNVVVHFDFDRADLTSGDQAKLQRVADALRGNRATQIRIVGNCDERGTEEYNLALGQRRAETAKRYLVDLGVESSRIDTLSYGHERPLDPRHSEEAWATNRRGELATLSK